MRRSFIKRSFIAVLAALALLPAARAEDGGADAVSGDASPVPPLPPDTNDAGVDTPVDAPVDAPASADAPIFEVAPDAFEEPSCGDLMIVLDRSGSMYFCSIDGRTKEAIAVRSLQTFIQQNPKVPMGLMVFPETVKQCGITTSCLGGHVAIGISPSGPVDIFNYLSYMPNSCGGTPTGDTMVGARDYTGWTPGKRHYVLLLTDGQPTCQDDFEGKCNGNGRSECAQPTKAFESIKALRDKGVHTFVVGFEGAATVTGGATEKCERPFNPETLNTMADLGGEAQAGVTRYYSATDEETLLLALKRISERVAGTTAGCGPGFDGGTGGAGGEEDAGGQDAQGGAGGSPVEGKSDPGCGCRLGGPTDSGACLIFGCAFAVLYLRRRRRSTAI